MQTHTGDIIVFNSFHIISLIKMCDNGAINAEMDPQRQGRRKQSALQMFHEEENIKIFFIRDIRDSTGHL